MGLDEALGAKKNTPPWVIRGMLRSGSLFAIQGVPKRSMKSLVAAHLSLCLAKGESFLGMETARCRVFVLDEDGNRGSLISAYPLLGVRPSDTSAIEFVSVDGSDVYQLIKLIIASVDSSEVPSVFIVDSICLLSCSEMHFKALRDLARQHNAVIVLLRHMTKSEYDEELFFLSDCFASLASQGKNRLLLRWLSYHGVSGYAQIRIKIKIKSNDERLMLSCPDGMQVSSVGASMGEVTVPTETKDKVRAVLAASPVPMTKEDIRVAARVRSNSVRPAVDELFEEGLLRKVGGKWVWNTNSEEASQ
jgi:hypothetical protein